MGHNHRNSKGSYANACDWWKCCQPSLRDESDESLGEELCVFVFNQELAMSCSSYAFVRQAGLDFTN